MKGFTNILFAIMPDGDEEFASHVIADHIETYGPHHSSEIIFERMEA